MFSFLQPVNLLLEFFCFFFFYLVGWLKIYSWGIWVPGDLVLMELAVIFHYPWCWSAGVPRDPLVLLVWNNSRWHENYLSPEGISGYKGVPASLQKVVADWFSCRGSSWIVQNDPPFFLFRVTPVAYGSSLARGQIGAADASLHHSHSNSGSEPCLWPTPQTLEMLDLFFFFLFFRTASMAYGGSQARGPIRAVAAGLRQSYSNAGSEQRLRSTPQLMATPDP